MKNLIAYIPVVNRQYLEWVGSHVDSQLFLVDQTMAQKLLPRLERNLIALSSHTISCVLRAVYPTLRVGSNFHPPSINLMDSKEFLMPDEDLSHFVAERYLYPAGCTVKFERVWGRWDMTAVKLQEPVIPDLEVSSAEIDVMRMRLAKKLAPRSPDWWRQIAAFAFRGDKLLACAFNQHFPTEYETVVFGDPRVNFDAGDPAGFEVYLSSHAEEGIICGCAATEGVSLEGASVYVDTFPCGGCARKLSQCKIKELFFSQGYSVLKGLETLRAHGIRVVKVKCPEVA